MSIERIKLLDAFNEMTKKIFTGTASEKYAKIKRTALNIEHRDMVKLGIINLLAVICFGVSIVRIFGGDYSAIPIAIFSACVFFCTREIYAKNQEIAFLCNSTWVNILLDQEADKVMLEKDPKYGDMKLQHLEISLDVLEKLVGEQENDDT